MASRSGAKLSDVEIDLHPNVNEPHDGEFRDLDPGSISPLVWEFFKIVFCFFWGGEDIYSA